MPAPARRPSRRSVAASASLGTLESTVALTLGHLAAGGAAPDAATLLTFAVLTYGASTLVLRRRAGITVVLPALLLAQLFGHAWLTTLTHAGYAGHAGQVRHAGEGLAALGLSPAMLAAHVLAAVVTGAMWALRRRVVARVLRLLDAPLPLPRGRRLLAAAAGTVRHDVRPLRVAPSRGPPAALAPVTV